MGRILVVTSVAKISTCADGSPYQSVVWADEFLVIHERQDALGCKVEVAFPAGGASATDPQLRAFNVQDWRLIHSQSSASPGPLAQAIRRARSPTASACHIRIGSSTQAK